MEDRLKSFRLNVHQPTSRKVYLRFGFDFTFDFGSELGDIAKRQLNSQTAIVIGRTFRILKSEAFSVCSSVKG